MPHTLVVEEDAANARLLQILLENDGYEVTTIQSPHEALALLAEHPYDIVTLDVDLSGIGGLELCRRIRSNSSIPIIFIAARADVEHKVAGLKAGADDYVAKPFEPGEVLARIWRLLHRAQHRATGAHVILRTPDLMLDPLDAKVTLMRTGTRVDLTPIELRLLRHLMSNSGQSITRAALTVEVWGYEYESSSNQLDMYISRLRKKIECDPADPRLLVTVRGDGYRLQSSIQ
jgi:two-component system, OmpR family, response regulator MtrA